MCTSPLINCSENSSKVLAPLRPYWLTWGVIGSQKKHKMHTVNARITSRIITIYNNHLLLQRNPSKFVQYVVVISFAANCLPSSFHLSFVPFKFLRFHTSTPKSFCKYSLSSASFRPMGAKTKEDMRFDPIPWFSLKWLAWQGFCNFGDSKKGICTCKDKNIKNHVNITSSNLWQCFMQIDVMYLCLCFLFSDPAQFPRRQWW